MKFRITGIFSWFAKYLSILWFCKIIDRPVPTAEKPIGEPLRGEGDYCDQFAKCARCGGHIHRDLHIFGDAIWRHYHSSGDR